MRRLIAALVALVALVGVAGAGTVTVTKIGTRESLGTRLMVFVTLSYSASYATGGDTINLVDLGLVSVDVIQLATPITTGGYTPSVDVSGAVPKLLAFAGGGGVAATFSGTPVTPTGVISTPTFTVKTGTIGANMSTGLTANTSSADLVGGTGITADRTLTTHSPIGTPSFTGDPITPAGVVNMTGGGLAGQVAAATDLHTESVIAIAYGH